jgi:hypothetical protein
MIQDSPDHSSLTVIRDRLPLEVHDQVFTQGQRAKMRSLGDM